MSTEAENNSTSINRLNWINLAAYVINTAVTYGIGVGVVGDLPTNAELSQKYQTLVTPAGWAFAIWGFIFLFQFVWVSHQLAAKKQRNSPYVLAVGYNYLWVCLAQAGWTIAFSHEHITTSLIMMLTIWGFLAVIVRDIYHCQETSTTNDFSLKKYILWFLPFTMHFGWITAASAVNINLELVSLGASSTIQFYTACISLLVLVGIALYLLQFDSVIPLVVSWAFWGVYNELANPKPLIVDSFNDQQVQFIRWSDAIALGVLLLCIQAVWIWRKMTQLGIVKSETTTKSEEKLLSSK